MAETRVILYHKHHTSARTRFLRLAYGGVCAFGPLPELSQVWPDNRNSTDEDEKVVMHPGALAGQAERELGLSAGALEAQGGFRVGVDVPDGEIQVYLARFTAVDPPFELAEEKGARFVDLTQARGLPPVELEVLRKAYEYILG